MEGIVNASMDIRALPNAYAPTHNHYPGGVNTNNQTKWLDTIAKLTLYGSEFPIVLQPPSSNSPFYRFSDGTPVDGFLINSYATGYNIPVMAPPSLVIPKQQGPIQFGNTQIRYQKRHQVGGNMFHLR